MTTYGGTSDDSEPDAALRTLRSALRQAHLRAGEPSTRMISARTGKAISHTTVAAVLRCERVPRWSHVELVLEALGVDAEILKSLWIAAREAQIGRPEEVQGDLEFGRKNNAEGTGVLLLIHLASCQRHVFGDYASYSGVVDCRQIIEWHQKYGNRLFSNSMRSFSARWQAGGGAAHLQRIRPEMRWDHLNGIIIEAERVLSLEMDDRYAEALVCRNAVIISGIQTVSIISSVANELMEANNRPKIFIRVTVNRHAG